ncbi:MULTISPECIES: hypothetical protein [Candidatus Fukatsuia]|nr:hypothetical protein [Candidatus Fukatsuia symbiotica]
MADIKIWEINEDTPSSGYDFSVKITLTLIWREYKSITTAKYIQPS